MHAKNQSIQTQKFLHFIDELFFYLPAFYSILSVLAGALAIYLLIRIFVKHK